MRLEHQESQQEAGVSEGEGSLEKENSCVCLDHEYCALEKILNPWGKMQGVLTDFSFLEAVLKGGCRERLSITC